MAANPERALLIKNLENSKLRRRIQELEEEVQQLAGLMDENDGLRRTIQEAEGERSSLQNQFKVKLRQIQEDSERLREEAVDARRSQYRAEEEIVMVGEKNGQLENKVQKSQRQVERMEDELKDVVKKSYIKERGLDNALDNLNATRMENRLLQVEVGKLSGFLKNIQLDLRKKQSTIVKISNQLEEASKSLADQDALKSQIEKLEANQRSLQKEIEKGEGNKDTIADVLFKNKDLLAENKKLKEENIKVFKQKADLEKDKNQIEEKLKNLANQEHLKSSLEGCEVLLPNCNFGEKNKLLKRKTQANSAETGDFDQSLVKVLKENEALKQRIGDLENSNFQKLNIIAKLKTNSGDAASSS